MRHDPGLAASPPVRYMLKVEGSGYSPFPYRPLWTDNLLAKRRRATPGPARLAGQTFILCFRVYLPDVVGCELPHDDRMHDLLLVFSCADGRADGDARSSIWIEVAYRDQEQPEVAYLGQQPVQGSLIGDRA